MTNYCNVFSTTAVNTPVQSITIDDTGRTNGNQLPPNTTSSSQDLVNRESVEESVKTVIGDTTCGVGVCKDSDHAEPEGANDDEDTVIHGRVINMGLRHPEEFYNALIKMVHPKQILDFLCKCQQDIRLLENQLNPYFKVLRIYFNNIKGKKSDTNSNKISQTFFEEFGCKQQNFSTWLRKGKNHQDPAQALLMYLLGYDCPLKDMLKISTGIHMFVTKYEKEMSCYDNNNNNLFHSLKTTKSNAKQYSLTMLVAKCVGPKPNLTVDDEAILKVKQDLMKNGKKQDAQKLTAYECKVFTEPVTLQHLGLLNINTELFTKQKKRLDKAIAQNGDSKTVTLFFGQSSTPRTGEMMLLRTDV